MNKILSAMVLLGALMAAPVAVSPAIAQACLGNQEVQGLVASGDILPLADILSRGGVGSDARVLNARVCDQGGQLYYLLDVLDASGAAQTLHLHAVTGSP